MPTFQVAHLREQGQDIIIVLVDTSFGYKSQQEQNEVCASLQACASRAGLAGTVVPIWDAGGGRMQFLAPEPWVPFFQSMSLADFAASVNRELTCG